MRGLDQCRCCGNYHDTHRPNCPVTHPDSKAAIALHDSGWNAGRRYQFGDHGPKDDEGEPWQHHPFYLMGYGNGTVAAEEAANGHSPY